MATTAYFDIESALQTALNSISGKPYIDFEASPVYTPTVGTKWWRTTHIPTLTEQVTADGLRKHTGIYKVDVIIPHKGKGLKIMLNDLDTIAGVFDTVTSLVSNNTKVQIDGVTRGQISREDSWLYGFVKILYTCYSY